ncbi:atrial natriuretic peptide receptor 1-like [Mytilus edulis]|uniref:atrial natriuretic peptide receptor 1-like n=1 Tax=Mytilus edulis TaxID=6550 RepID=UPI0039EF66B0
MYIFIDISLLLLLLVLCVLDVNGREFRIAWMAPKNTYHGLNASSSVGALKLALQAIDMGDLLVNHTVRVKWYDSDCNQKSALAATVSAKSNFEPDLFLGPPCSSAMRGVAQLASYWRRPVFGWVSNDIEFRNRTIYSTLIRLLGPLNKLPDVMRYVSKMFKWNRFSMIHDEAAPYVAVAVAIAENKDTTIKSTHEVSERMEDSVIESIFQQVRKYSRILIFAVPKHTLRRYMVVAHRLGMSSGDFAFLCIHGDLYTWQQLNDEVLTEAVWRKNDTDDQGARQAFESVLHIIMPTLSAKLSENLDILVNKMKNKENANWINFPPVSKPDAYAPYLYDATLTWAIMVDRILKDNKDPSDGDIMFKRTANFYQEGLTNFIVLDAEGDRLLNFWMLDMQENGRFQRIMEIKYQVKKIVANTTVRGDKLVRWANGKYGLHNAPPDVPACGFENEHCREDFTNTIVGAVCGSSFVLVVAIIINIVFRRYRRVQLLRSMIWQVKFEDIDFVTALLHGSVRNSFKNLSRRRTSSNKKKASRTSSGSGGGVIISSNSSPPQFHKPDGGAMFGSVAYVRGSLVSVKRLNKGNITMTKDVLHQLNQLMELKQQNVCAFVGASFDPGRILLLWEYCPKGSIQDVIWNQNIKLDQMFKFALSLDIVKGLDFVHKSSVQYHGNLKSTNCVVDSRWTCKLTDFGVPGIRYVDRNIQEEPHDKLLWTAPEVLRNEKVLDEQKADLFSLGIILKEVFTRSGPYTEFPFLQPSDIIEKVREVPDGPVFRPLITVDFRKQNPDLFGVIDELWNDDPLHRPSASRAYKVLHRINPSKNLTMIDNMIAILEKYANHLEDLVAERTSELDAEKKKTENLLYRMLPRSVAEDLKAGKQVKAEQFDEATIYFSDIVGFTTICASSTPIEVVNLLNSLYTLFDDIITRYDVYKVETIGDAYMLASGLPKRNGSRHIREIADCALNILESITTFYIPHQQNQTVRIRIGIHSGSVVAGVVGMAMPRYCLFGDTVNTASRMESTGLPMKIHLSTVAAENLQQYDNYKLNCRGEISVKGKGLMKTFFLCGKYDGTQSLQSINEDKKTIVTSTSGSELNRSSPTRHVSTVSNALESRIGIGHYGDIPDIIHKCKSRPSLQSILSIEASNFNPVRRSSSTETTSIRKISVQSEIAENGCTMDDSSERTNSLESGYFPADSSCSSVERTSPGVHRTNSFENKDKNLEASITECKKPGRRKDNLFSQKYFPPTLSTFDEKGQSVINRYSLETCLDSDKMSAEMEKHWKKTLDENSFMNLKLTCDDPTSCAVDCLKECILKDKTNAKVIISDDLLSEKTPAAIDVLISQDVTPELELDLLPEPEQRIRRRSSKTIMTEVTAL